MTASISSVWFLLATGKNVLPLLQPRVKRQYPFTNLSLAWSWALPKSSTFFERKATLVKFTRDASDMLFLREYTAPFTNNQAERDLRHCKAKQKNIGCYSHIFSLLQKWGKVLTLLERLI
jgi:hypothetical protein